MRHIFIINHMAGKHDITSHIMKEIEANKGKTGFQPLVFISEYPGNETETVERMCHLFRGEDIRFYCVGGTGTLCNVINGVKDFKNVEFTAYPCGLTNDFIKNFDCGKNGFKNLGALINGKTVDIDVIEVGERHFINAVSIGLGAGRIDESDFYRILAKLSPTLPYTLYTVAEVVFGKRLSFDIDVNGQHFSEHYTMLSIFNGAYLGGNIHPFSDVRPNDESLRVILFRAVNVFKGIGLISAFKSGNFKRTGYYAVHYKTNEIDIKRTDGSTFTLNGDGERFPCTSAHIKLKPKALKFVIPEDAKILPADE